MFETAFHLASVFKKQEIDFFQFLTVSDLRFGLVSIPGVEGPCTPSRIQVQMLLGLKEERSVSV